MPNKNKRELDKRPSFTNRISLKDFIEFYWLKEELVDFCRKEGLKRSGNKIEISNRIESYLQTLYVQVFFIKINNSLSIF